MTFPLRSIKPTYSTRHIGPQVGKVKADQQSPPPQQKPQYRVK